MKRFISAILAFFSIIMIFGACKTDIPSAEENKTVKLSVFMSQSRSAYPSYEFTEANNVYLENNNQAKIFGKIDPEKNMLIFTIPKDFKNLGMVKIYIAHENDYPIIYSSADFSTLTEKNGEIKVTLSFNPFESNIFGGYVSLGISTNRGWEYVKAVFEADDDTLSKISIYCGSYCTINTISEIPGGSYPVHIYVYQNSDCTNLLYYEKQTIVVWPGFTTENWYLPDGTFDWWYTIPYSRYSSTFYVCGEYPCSYLYKNSSQEIAVPSDDNAGTALKPLKTLKAALDKCVFDFIDYTIYVDGLVSYSSEEILRLTASNNNGILKSLSIVGMGGSPENYNVNVNIDENSNICGVEFNLPADVEYTIENGSKLRFENLVLFDRGNHEVFIKQWYSDSQLELKDICIETYNIECIKADVLYGNLSIDGYIYLANKGICIDPNYSPITVPDSVRGRINILGSGNYQIFSVNSDQHGYRIINFEKSENAERSIQYFTFKPINYITRFNYSTGVSNVAYDGGNIFGPEYLDGPGGENPDYGVFEIPYNEYYVNLKYGSDSNAGSPQYPFASIQEAVDRIRMENNGFVDFKIILTGDYEYSADEGEQKNCSIVNIDNANNVNSLEIEFSSYGEGNQFTVKNTNPNVSNRLFCILGSENNKTAVSFKNLILSGGHFYEESYDNRFCKGGAIYSENAQISLSNCVLTNNKTLYGGSGIYFSDSNSSLHLAENVVTDMASNIYVRGNPFTSIILDSNLDNNSKIYITADLKNAVVGSQVLVASENVVISNNYKYFSLLGDNQQITTQYMIDSNGLFQNPTGNTTIGF